MSMANQGLSSGKFVLASKWKVLLSVIFGLFMVFLDSTVVNVAFQTLRREFDASLAQSQWVISTYVLALGISTPYSDPRCDICVGRNDSASSSVDVAGRSR